MNPLKVCVVMFSLFLMLSRAAVEAQSLSGRDAKLVVYPETVVYNGRIVTMDDRSTTTKPGTVVSAMAVRNGKVFSLGDDKGVLDLAGPDTLKIDLKGRTVIPGLIDTHSHVHDYSDHWGLPGLRPVVRVSGNTDAQLTKNIEEAVRAAVKTAKPGEWIQVSASLETAMRGSTGDDDAGEFAREKKFKRGALDVLAPNNPVSLNAGGMVLNRKAIEFIESFYQTRMADEAIDRESGVVNFATEVSRALPLMLLHDRPDVIKENVRKELEEWAGFGITTFSSHINVPGHVNVYAELDRKGQMPIRFAWTHRSGTLFNWQNAAGFYSRMGDLSGSGSDYWWNIGSTVGHLDYSYPGVATTIAAKPEIKAREQNYGDPGDIKRETMFHMIRSGHRITGTHIAGDLAVERFMDIVEEGSKAANMTADQIRERNHVMDHCTMGPTPAQYERLKRLNITMSCAPKYIAGTARRILSDYGEQYVERVVPMKGMIESGVKTVWEIDTHPTGSAFYYLELPVTRKTADGRVWGSAQRVDRVLVLKSATSWASEYVMKATTLGTLEPGKWADFLVLNRDYFTVPEDDLSEIKPLLTVVGGNISYLDPVLEPEIKGGRIGRR